MGFGVDGKEAEGMVEEAPSQYVEKKSCICGRVEEDAENNK